MNTDFVLLYDFAVYYYTINEYWFCIIIWFCRIFIEIRPEICKFAEISIWNIFKRNERECFQFCSTKSTTDFSYFCYKTKPEVATGSAVEQSCPKFWVHGIGNRKWCHKTNAWKLMRLRWPRSERSLLTIHQSVWKLF